MLQQSKTEKPSFMERSANFLAVAGAGTGAFFVTPFVYGATHEAVTAFAHAHYGPFGHVAPAVLFVLIAATSALSLNLGFKLILTIFNARTIRRGIS